MISTQVPDETVALLLSGGVDSLSLGFAAEAAGKKVHAYTFKMLHVLNEDAVSAALAAAALGWEHTVVDVDPLGIEGDFLDLARVYRGESKARFECAWPILHLAPRIAEKFVLSGIAADGHFGLSKRAMIHCRRPKKKFDAYREEYFTAPNPAGQKHERAILLAHGKNRVAPYLTAAVRDLFGALSWDEINRPRQKQVTLDAFPEGFAQVKVRPHANLQLVAGIPAIFETLLLNPRLNFKGRTRVLDLCRDWHEKTKGQNEKA